MRRWRVQIPWSHRQQCRNENRDVNEHANSRTQVRARKRRMPVVYTRHASVSIAASPSGLKAASREETPGRKQQKTECSTAW